MNQSDMIHAIDLSFDTTAKLLRKAGQEGAAKELDDALIEVKRSITAPQPEASDREIAGEIIGMGATYGAGNDQRKIGEIVDDACHRIATIRADERRKAAEWNYTSDRKDARGKEGTQQATAQDSAPHR
jgi:hypothetical protein